MTGAAVRGLRNPFRSRLRAGVVVVLLALVTGFLALNLVVQAALASRDQIARLDARVRTLVELREAGAFCTGGFGGDKPVGEHDFSVDTLERLRRIPNASHLAKIEEYVYTPQVDPMKPNAYAMVIGTLPGAAMRAIGEVDYESARIIAGRALRPEDARERVAVVGRLYARQRLGIAEPGTTPLSGQQAMLGGQGFQVVGVYTTANDFGDPDRGLTRRHQRSHRRVRGPVLPHPRRQALKVEPLAADPTIPTAPYGDVVRGQHEGF